MTSFKKYLVAIMMTATLAGTMAAQHDKTAYYKACSYEYGGITLPYRELVLNQDKTGPSMLVIQLHGGSARGDDNAAQLGASAVDSVEMFLRVHQYKAVFLLPQCGKDRVWNESKRSQSIPMTEVLTHWLQDYVTNHDIDTTRVYITGYSAGGSGTWRMLNDNPHTFAAACVAAATPLMVEAENVKHTPVYAIAGDNDAIMDADKIETFVNAICDMGGTARFDLLEGKDHFATCDEAFTRERLAWMFGHSRETSSVARVAADRQEKRVVGLYAIDGTILNDGATGLVIVRYSDGTATKTIRQR